MKAVIDLEAFSDFMLRNHDYIELEDLNDPVRLAMLKERLRIEPQQTLTYVPSGLLYEWIQKGTEVPEPTTRYWIQLSGEASYDLEWDDLLSLTDAVLEAIEVARTSPDSDEVMTAATKVFGGQVKNLTCNLENDQTVTFLAYSESELSY